MITEAQKRATKKYQKKAYDRIVLNVKKGMRDIIKDNAARAGYSVNGYINKLLSDNIQDFDPIE